MTRLRLLAASLVLLTALGGAALLPAGTTTAATARAGDQQAVDVLIELAEPSLIERVLDEQAVAGQQLSAFAQRQHVQALQLAQAPIVAEAARYGAVYAQLTHTIDGVGVAGVNTGDLAALGRLPGVRAVHIVPDFTYDLGTSVQFIGGQQALEQSGLDGRGTRIAIIDTGIDYTHRDFGGPGTPEAYALAKEKLAQAPPSYRGAALFPTPKLAGGFDYVGDAWTGRCPECAGQGVAEVVGPAPDPNPLDLAGHGTHVAGIAAGFGVPNSSVGGSIPAAFVRPGEAFSVFHGVAPAAQLYAYKVCSSAVNRCNGLAMIAAMDRATDPNNDGRIDDRVDAINLSIGADFASSPATAQAASRMVRAGIAVAISAGNSGDVPFVTGSPAAAERVLGVASSSAPKPLYGLLTEPGTARGIPFIWQPWSRPLEPPTTGALIEARSVVALPAPTAGLGCPQPGGVNPFPPGSLAGKIALIQRGVCPVSDKGAMAEGAGALAAIIVSQPSSPPASLSPGALRPHIPVVMIAAQNGQLLAGMLRDGAPVRATIGTNVIGDLADVLSGFSSRGPSRYGNPKPDLTAPGDGIVSAAAGSGDQGVAMSGTSMAAPHVAGALALMKQAHPGWSAQEREAVLVNTARPQVYTSQFVAPPPFDPAPISRAGAGRIDVVAAAQADSVITGDLLAHAGFGFQAVPAATSLTRPITIANKGTAEKTYDLSVAFEGEAPPGVAIAVSPTSVTVPAGGVGTATVTMALDPQLLRPWLLTHGPSASTGAALDRVEVAGFVAAVDRGSGRRYRVPFYALPRGASDIVASPAGADQVTLSNRGALAGTAEVFSLLAVDPKDVPPDEFRGTDRLDIRYVGARFVPIATRDGTVYDVEFAIKTAAPLQLPMEAEFDIFIDSDDDGRPDYVVFNVDQGFLSGAGPTGVNVVAVANLATRQITGPYFAVDAKVWSSGLVMRVPARVIGLENRHPFNLLVAAEWAFEGNPHVGAQLLDLAPNGYFATFSPAEPRFTASASTVRVAPGAAQTVQVGVDPRATGGDLGLLILYRDNVPPDRDADIVVSADGLRVLTRQFVADAAVADVLVGYLDAAAAAGGDPAAATAALNAFVDAVGAQSGRALTPEQAATLIALARAP